MKRQPTRRTALLASTAALLAAYQSQFPLSAALGASASPDVGAAIDDAVWVEGAATRLFLELKGQTDRGPILLHLHGGPGSGWALVAFRAYVGPAFEKEALVGYFHQRGVLRSPMVPTSALTVSNNVADVVK